MHSFEHSLDCLQEAALAQQAGFSTALQHLEERLSATFDGSMSLSVQLRAAERAWAEQQAASDALSQDKADLEHKVR